MSRLAANLGLLLAAAIWGGGFVAQSSAMAAMSPGWFTGLRFALAFLAVAPLGLIEARRAGRPLSWSEWRSMIPLGFVFFAGTSLQQIAIETTSVTHVGFLTGLYVIFVPCLEILFFRRRLHWTVWIGALLAVAGTWFLGGGFNSLTSGDLLTIAAGLCFAGQIILLERVVKSTGRPVAAALFLSLSCIVLGTAWGATEGVASLYAIPSVWPELIYAGVFSAGVAFLLQAIFQRHTGPTDAAIMLMTESLFAALFAAILLGERLSATGWIGASLLFAGVVIAQTSPLFARKEAGKISLLP